MIKTTSKITILASLLVATMVNAQEFYTCVPKKSWWKDTMGESIRNNVPSAHAIANAVAGSIPKPQSGWKLIKKIHLGEIDIPLTFGKYKIKLCSREEIFEALDGDSLNVTKDNTWREWDVSYPGDYFSITYGGCSSEIVELYKYE